MIVDERMATYLESISWQISPHLREVEEKAREREVPIIRRSMQSLLAFLIRLQKPERVLEIGTAVGFSAMLMREELPKEAVFDTIEKVPARIRDARENFANFNHEEDIHLLEGDAAEVLERLVSEGKQYDFIFMDAAKGQYSVFLEFIEKLLVPGGMLVTDNVLQDGEIIQSRYAVNRRDRTIHGRMRDFLYYLTHSEQWDSVILPVGDGVAISVKKGDVPVIVDNTCK
ncbi:MAG: O-methyltransferase [Lachnospiraceae bacterium]|nr:O-methyltransferase [Lachnospiraceae bacterium]